LQQSFVDINDFWFLQAQSVLIARCMPEAEDFDGLSFLVDFVEDEIITVGEFFDIGTLGKSSMALWKNSQGLSLMNQLIAELIGSISIALCNSLPD
jgi:hypothetical protein